MADDREAARKWLHLAPGLLAFLVRDLGYGGSVALTAGLLAFNLWWLPRLGGRRLWRPAESRRGGAPGMVFYPLALLALALATPGRPEVLAGAWGMLAFGDAAATLAGRRWGRRALPWNRDKTWVGTLAFVVASALAVGVLVAWTSGGRPTDRRTLVVAAVAALVGAAAESLPWRLDDNLSVTLLGGAAIYGAEVVTAGVAAPAPGIAGWLSAATLLTLLARLAGLLDDAGAAAGWLVAVAVAVGGGWPALSLLALFVLASSAAGAARRRSRGRLPRREAPRGARNVLANGAVAGACGLLLAWPGGEGAAPALVGALAVATADTVGGELGMAIGGRTRRITDGRPVEPGVDGGVSWAGTATGALGAAAVGGGAVIGGLLPPGPAAVAAGVGVVGSLLDSLLGATLERRGLLDNEGVNLLSTLSGAWLAAQLAAMT